MSVLATDPSPALAEQRSLAPGFTRLLVLFALSGAAGLIYELVWFQLLRLTIGINSQSLALLLACYMGGLFIGALGYARVVPKRWNPLRTYAVLELLIAVCGLALPFALGAVRAWYLSHAGNPQTLAALRTLLCVGLLAPPTILMGATLPALARWVRSDEAQAGRIGRLYAANILGAVVGVFGAAFALLPQLETAGANRVAIGLNVVVAVLAWSMRRSYTPPVDTPCDPADHAGAWRLPVYLAYGLNGVAALAFEVVWSRLLAVSFAATVYAFALVLGVFLLGLGLGGAAGSAIGSRTRHPRRALAAVQLCIVAAVAGTAYLVPFMSMQFTRVDRQAHAGPLDWTITNLIRTVVVVFPGALLWGMSFPLAVAGLGRNLGDAARPVGRLYAFNTVGAVLGSLLTSFVLFPRVGSDTAVSQLILIPIVAAIILMLPRRVPHVAPWLLALGAVALAFGTPWPSHLNDMAYTALRRWVPMDITYIVGIPVLLGVAALLITRVRIGWAMLLAAGGLAVTATTIVPPQLYMLGRHYAHSPGLREMGEILLFEEGALEPIVVFRGTDGSLQVSINSKVCASSNPGDMQTQRLLGLIPVLLSTDPSECLVIGLGAGVTAGAVTVSDDVKHVDIVELERKVPLGTRKFAEFNNNVMDSPKINLMFADGRHHIATTPKRYGVITSDPVDPWMAGAAALYTEEHFKTCRTKLKDGGMFMQWVGMYDLDERGMKSILAAFASAFPEGSFWITPLDILLVGGTGPLKIDVAAMRRRFEREPQVAEALAFVGLPTADDFLSCYLCSCASIKGFLAGAPVNRDSNLFVQYTGGFSYYEWNYPELREMLMNLRAWDDSVFDIPVSELGTFRRGIEQRWQRYADTAHEELRDIRNQRSQSAASAADN
jgi:spermidine synthase